MEIVNVTKLYDCNPERVLFNGVQKKVDLYKPGTSSASPKTYFLNYEKCYEIDLDEKDQSHDR